MISDATPETHSKLDRVSWLKKRHYIDERAAWAAALLLEDCEKAERLLARRPDSEAVPGRQNRTTSNLAEHRLSAARRIEAAKSMLGPDLTEMLTLVVVRNLALPDAAAAMGVHSKAAIPLVRAGLQVLSAFYLQQGGA